MLLYKKVHEKDGEAVERAIDKLLNLFIDTGQVDSRGKYGEIELVIKEDEMVRIDGKDPDYTEEDEMDWDMLDEEDFGDDYGETE